MSNITSTFSTQLQHITGRRVEEAEGRARRLQLMMTAGLSSLLFAALWGLAAGSASLGLAVANLYKVPMIVLLAASFSVPAGLLALRVSGADYRVSDLMISFFTAVFSGSLVLGVLSPLVALYYHTSAWAGPFLGMGSAFLALGVAGFVFVRATLRRRSPQTQPVALALPTVVMVVMNAACLLQLVALASPILPEATIFESGVDGVIARH
jgi:MFS family permease